MAWPGATVATKRSATGVAGDEVTTALGIAVMLLLAFAALGVRASYRDARHNEPADVDADAGVEAEWDPVGDLARARYLDAWDALGGRATRLALLAIASDEMSQRCREAAVSGQGPVRALGADDDCFALPDELSDRVGRPGDPVIWQALDRALRRLSAIADSPDAGVHADAHEAVSIAARDLADELDGLDLTEDLDHCWFCGRGQETVPRLLCSVRAAICSDCVQACHERLYEL